MSNLDSQIETARRDRLKVLLAATRPSINQVQRPQGDGTHQTFLEVTIRGMAYPLIPLQANVENYRRS